MKSKTIFTAILALLASISCSKDNTPGTETPSISLQEVAVMLSHLPIGQEQLDEVHDAVSSSSGNGYDEEYTMSNLFSEPGSGVGDSGTKSSGKQYGTPLRDLITNYLKTPTKAASSIADADGYIAALTSSDVQIYWPFSELWDGETAPVVTFDPGEGYDTNIGYRLSEDAIEEVIVTEQTAKETPVWVVNRNDDSGFDSLEMLRRKGEVIVKPSVSTRISGAVESLSKDSSLRTLLLKEFTARRSYDSWFAGASEFFVKCGSVEDFSASTEAELKLYSPSITDFMIVVKRGDIGKTLPMDIILVSEWTDQLESCAFMITEDDGGTQTSWKCAAEVKIKSKTYGFDISLPFRTRDDIVWRGQLGAKYLEKNSGRASRFGDIDLSFEITETD